MNTSLSATQGDPSYHAMDSPMPVPDDVYLSASTAEIHDAQTNPYARSKRSPHALNRDYPKTISALMKLAEMVVGVTIATCAGSASGGAYVYNSAAQPWSLFVSILGTLLVGISYITYLTNIVYNLPQYWPFVQMAFYAIWSLFYLITAIVCTAHSSEGGAVAAAAFFSYLGIIFFAIDTIFHYLAWRTHSLDVPVPILINFLLNRSSNDSEQPDTRY